MSRASARSAAPAALGLTAAASLLLALTAVLVLGAAPSPAGAQEEADGAPATPPLVVVEQTSWVVDGGTFQLLLDAPDAPDDATLTVVVHDAVGSRSAFARSLTAEDLGDVSVGLDPVPIGLLPRDTGDTISVTLGPQVTDELGGPGVYPVDVVFTGPDGVVLHRLVTHLVRLPGNTGSPPLRVAAVLPVDASPALQPDGTTVIGPDALEGLQVAADALTDHPDLPLTVDPSPETLQALADAEQPDLVEVLDQLATGVAATVVEGDGPSPLPIPTRQVLGGPYVDLDLVAWVSTDLAGGPLAGQVTTGTAAVDEHLEVRADRRTWVDTTATTPQSLSRLAELGVDQVVLPEAALQPLDQATFPVALTQPFEVMTDTGELQRAAAADTALLGHVGSTGDPVLDAHHLLADLAVLYFDRPALSRGVPVPLPDGELPPAFLGAFLGGLEEPQQVLSAVTLDLLFASVADAGAGGEADTSGNPLVRPLVPTVPADLGAYPDDLALTELTLLGYRSLVGPDHPELDVLDQLTLASADGTLSSSGRTAYLASVSDRIQTTVEAIEAPDDQTITLTARTGTIPLRLRNGNAFPVAVVVDLESERLEFPDGEQISTILQPGDTQLDVQVRTRASGAFPLEARVGSPDGIIELSSTEYRVRSTALSGVGVVLSVGAGLILLNWWARHFRSLRRNRALVSASGRPAAGATDAPDGPSQAPTVPPADPPRDHHPPGSDG